MYAPGSGLALTLAVLRLCKLVRRDGRRGNTPIGPEKGLQNACSEFSNPLLTTDGQENIGPCKHFTSVLQALLNGAHVTHRSSGLIIGAPKEVQARFLV